MDPFVVIKYGESLYRTRVIRHDLNPMFNDKFILFVRRSTPDSMSDSGSAVPFEGTVSFSLLDWERMKKDNHVGNASLDVLPLIDLAPKPDPETGLYSEEAMRLHGFQELTLNLILDQKKKDHWEGQSSSGIVVR
jgi:phosphatidylserine decarboxylase